MILSKTCIYGILATLHLATKEDKEYLPISQIAKELDISFHFLTKILQKLTQKEIMSSYRGPNGGIALARPKEEIKLMDIVVAIDGSEIFEQCLLKLPGCGKLKPCPLHDEWSLIRKQIQEMLSQTSLASVAEKIVKNSLRLADVNPLEL